MGKANTVAIIPRPLQGAIWRIATSTTTNTISVPNEWRGNQVMFRATDSEAQIAFSTGTATDLTLDQLSTVANDPDDMTAVAGSGITFAKDEWVDVEIGSSDLTFEVIAPAAGFLEAYVSVR